MIYGLYRGGFGDLYKIERTGVLALGDLVILKNLTNGTETLMAHADALVQIDKGWLVKTTVSDLGSDTN